MILQKLKLKKDDILLVKGEYTQEEISVLLKEMQDNELNNLVFVVSDIRDIETMKKEELVNMLQLLIEKKEENET